MKKCHKCNTTKSLYDFAKNKKKKDGLQSSCKECTAKYKLEYYSKNKKTLIEKASIRKKDIRDWLLEYKSNLICVSCETSVHPAALDFHHKDGKDKEENIATMLANGLGREKILEEIEKCDPVCANCHRILHYNERINAGIA